MSEAPAMDPTQWARYQRQVAVLGRSAQFRLSNSKVMVIGLGGLGVVATTQLCLSGVRTLVINDYDIIELSNLSRQFLYTPQDLMRPKVKVCASRLRALRAEVEIVEIDGVIDHNELTRTMRSVDVALDCTDNFESRFAINRASVASSTPLVSASALARGGQVAVFDRRRPEQACYQCLFPHLDDEESDCNRAGVLVSVLGVVASIQVGEVIKILTVDDGDNPALLYRFDGGKIHRSRLDRDPECNVCANTESSR